MAPRAASKKRKPETYVIFHKKHGACFWSSWDKTLYTASREVSTFDDRNATRRAIRAAVKFWNHERFRSAPGSREPSSPSDYYVMRVRPEGRS